MPTNAIALSLLLVNERPSLVRFAVKIVGSEPVAEDVAQHLWLRVHNVRDDPPIANKRAYLYRLAANLAIDHVRAGRRHEGLISEAFPPEDVAEEQPTIEKRLIDQERLVRLEAAIADLPLRCRQVFTLRRLEGLPADEVAARLGITLNAVAKQVRIALRHCHERMREDETA